MNTKRLFLLFLSLVLLAGLALFIRIVQYEPLVPKVDPNDKASVQVPIFPDDPILGEKKASITIISFEDFGCTHCKTQSEFFDTLLQQHPGTFKVIWKLFPISKFPQDTTLANEYGYCANQQGKFNEFKAYAFENSSDLSETILKSISTEIKLDSKKMTTCLSSKELKDAFENNKNLAKLLNIQTLPTMFINNKQIPTPETLEGWKTFLGL